MPAEDLRGQKFGRLTAIRRVKNRGKKTYWLFVCDCGNKKEMQAGNVKSSHAISCGCHKQETHTKHGRHGSPEYAVWSAMKRRCNSPQDSKYPYYGGRGITVCDRWSKFDNFYIDMGLRPSPMHQIDRIDNNGNYEPGNCRWVTPTQNMRNQSKSKRWVVKGIEFASTRHAAEELRVPVSTIRCWCEGQTSRGAFYPPKHGCYSFQVYPESL